MALDYTGIGYGLEFDGGAVVFDISGAPSGTAKEDAAPAGSIAFSDTGATYRKKTGGAGADKWVEGASKEYVDSVASGQSWREPVLVKDDTVYADLATAETAVNTGTIDGETVVDTTRILFTGITGSAENVFIVTGTPGAGATLVEDTNTETTGDALYVQEGTDAGKQFSYNGAAWVQSGSGSLTELGFIQAFIGKDADGNELPTYSNTNYVSNGDSLELAIGTLDGQVGTNASAITSLSSTISTLQTEVNATQTSLGTAVNADGTFNGYSGTNYLDAATSMTDADVKLDTAIDNLGTNFSNLQTEVDALETSLGSQVNADGTWNGLSGTNYLDSATDNTVALTTLDTQVGTNATNITALQGGANKQFESIGATSHTAVGSLLVDDIGSAVYEVRVRDTTTGRVEVLIVDAGHNGHSGADASSIVHIESAKYKIGGKVNGLTIDAVLTGTGAAQTMSLTINTNNLSDVFASVGSFTGA
jgi:hypothetical protein